MGGAGDAQILREQWQQQQAANNAKYNKDGSGKANDYHPPVLPTSSMPAGPSGGNGHVMVHTDRLSQVATQMKAELTRLEASLSDLQSNGSGSATIMGWETADSLTANTSQAFAGISEFHANLNQAYQLVITNLHQTVINYTDAESVNSSAAHRVSGGTTLPSNVSST